MKLLSRAPADKYVVWAVLALGAVGVVAVYSAVSFLAETKAGGDTERFLLRHVGRLALALGMVGLFSLVDYRQLARKARIGVVAALALLLAVLVVGDASGGASRWVFGFQPSDLARVALLLHVAFLLAKKQGYIGDFKRAFVPLCLWTGAVVGLIGLEDLSTAAVVLVSVMLMCFVGRVRVLHLSGVVALGVVAAYLLLLASPERAERLEAYVGVKLFPHTDAEAVFSSQDEGYQARQARIAFAMGGLTGVGPGKSIQRDFLPAPYNDFIFAIIAEEYGILGALALLAVFVLLLFRGFLRIARHAPDPLGLLLGTGLVTMLALYGFIHAGVAAGLLPVTGLPMPFVSYGGTSMVANGVMVGILLNISRQATGPGAP
ncbi:FtsW/RodA/SpoVE family cell cycle protein [Rhodocaloribacter litoris]|uniref:FtsW/RodA/SpoVE family cell cycle protein n=1 Tax=Rhodocaloribacter litoris TaxID=2558931 RepID=UPI001E5A938C|nr:FtsW/RodA/SpoVE family cell cycle protein [Rhodocaloribacter litoris]